MAYFSKVECDFYGYLYNINTYGVFMTYNVLDWFLFYLVVIIIEL